MWAQAKGSGVSHPERELKVLQKNLKAHESITKKVTRESIQTHTQALSVLASIGAFSGSCKRALRLAERMADDRLFRSAAVHRTDGARALGKYCRQDVLLDVT